MRISLIAAMSENRVIGKNGKLPWPHLPNDWKNLFEVTNGCKMIMGRKSYDTPDRISSPVGNFVITRQQNFSLDPNFQRVGSLEEALNLCQQEKEVFVLGGEQIFRQALPLADCIHLTIVHGIFEGDAYFPEFSAEKFHIVSKKTYPADTLHAVPYTFLVYERK